MKKALIVFVKAPVRGNVKTRMHPHLSSDRILQIYRSFVKETISKCAALRGVDRFIGCYPSKEDAFLKKLAGTYGLKSFDQKGRDLGEKMLNAFKDYFKKGYSEVIIIGSDSPSLPADYIKKAFLELRKNDFILGPCCDGGLYLVGAKNRIRPELFRNIPWDSTSVMNETLNRMLKKLISSNINYTLLPFWYDVDTVEDLNFYRNHLRYLKKSYTKRQ